MGQNDYRAGWTRMRMAVTAAMAKQKVWGVLHIKCHVYQRISQHKVDEVEYYVCTVLKGPRLHYSYTPI